MLTSLAFTRVKLYASKMYVLNVNVMCSENVDTANNAAAFDHKYSHLFQNSRLQPPEFIDSLPLLTLSKPFWSFIHQVRAL